MSTEILQVREVDSADLALLRERAARQGTSLSAYVRDVLHDEASHPTNAEVIAQIAGESAVAVELDEVRAYIEAERSW